jgi:hypothetical protein
MASRNYSAAPTLAEFHLSRAFVRGVRGPVGSGKSVACAVEVFLKSCAQAPAPDGVRRTRWAITRNTYPELKSTTIKTWQDWIPDDICKIKYDSPINGRLLLEMEDGTRVDAEIYFLALDQPKDVKKLLSLELTGAWSNEAREMDMAIIDGLTQRVGRYPGKALGAPLSWSGVIMDTNSPDDRHWWAKFESAPPRMVKSDGRVVEWQFFKQPPALLRTPAGLYVPNPAAENVANHQKGYDYWLDMTMGKSQEWINVYVMNEFALLIDGDPVYAGFFSPTVHRSKLGLWPMRSRQVFLGWDFGLTPAVVFCQVTPEGQVRILDEVCAEGLGVRRFVQDAVMPLLKEKYQGCSFVSVGDPAGISRAATDERTCFEILDEELEKFGIDTEPAWSNDPTSRQEAVRFFLRRQTMGGDPMMMIDPECRMILKGFAGGYHYKIVPVSGGSRYRQTPEKNEYSHPHDALQYACLEIHKRMSASMVA